jgi:O-antigen/teichoic acid export membrane protein
MIGNQSIKGTIINYFGVVIGYVNTILLFPLYFTPEEFGLTRVLLSISVFLTQISQLGLGQVIIKFLPYFKEDQVILKSFVKYTIAVGCAGIVLMSALLFFSDDYIIQLYSNENDTYLSQYFYLLFPLTISLTLYEISDSYLRGYFKTIYSTFVREVFIRVGITALILLYYFKFFDFGIFIVFFIFVYVLAFLSLLVPLKNTLPVFQVSQSVVPLKEKMKRYMFRYGLYAVLTSAGSILINNIDIIMLGYLIDFKEVAIYSVAFYIAVIIQIPQRNLSRIIIPVLSESWKKRDLPKISTLYKKSSLILLFTGAFIFSAIWVNIEDMFSMMPKSDIYKQGKYVVLFIGISKVIDMVASINTEIISVSKFYVFNFISLVLLVVLAVITNSLLIPLYEANGAAIATLISIALYNSVKMFYLYRKLNIHPFTAKEVLIIIAMLFFIFLPEMLKSTFENIFVGVAIKTFVVVVVFAIIAYLLKMHLLIKKENLR